MILEDQRFLHEDLERLEQAIATRVAEEPRQTRERLIRDHQIASFLDRTQEQSTRLLAIYKDGDGSRAREIQSLSTGDPFKEFYKQLTEIKEFHHRYPNEPVENLEKAYKRKAPGEGDVVPGEVDNMFTGEEAYGRFLDLTTLHEDYLNLQGAKRWSYLQYLELFDKFGPPESPITRTQKNNDRYFDYVGRLATYLEGFMRRTQPLENLDRTFEEIGQQFSELWDADEVPGWTSEVKIVGSAKSGSVEGIWCDACQKEFTNENVYTNHLTGKKHVKAQAALDARQAANGTNGEANGDQLSGPSLARLKERAIAEREYRVIRLTDILSQERTDTRSNVERKQGMTERERQMELDALFAESLEPSGGASKDDDDSDGDQDEKVYNPLKLPLAWDGKPIPYWLYKLHGLGVEFPCEICGNFVYMGRRAFDKHFNEARHIHGLKCLGITNTALFREITGIEDALKLWDKITRDKKQEKKLVDGIVQMEDGEGNVMPEKVYYDLQKQGLL